MQTNKTDTMNNKIMYLGEKYDGEQTEHLFIEIKGKDTHGRILRYSSGLFNRPKFGKIYSCELTEESVKYSKKGGSTDLIELTEGKFISTRLHFKEFFKERGVKFLYNTQTKKCGRLESDSYKGLCLKIKDYGEDAVSRVLIDEETIIKYHIETCASYCLGSDGEIVPDGNYAGAKAFEEGRSWQKSTIESHAASPHTSGIWFYVKPYKIKTYQYKSGRKTKEEEHISERSISKEEQPFLHWICSIRSTKPSHSLRTIEYNEKNAKFFVDFYKGICKLNMAVREFTNPDTIEQFIESNDTLRLL